MVNFTCFFCHNTKTCFLCNFRNLKVKIRILHHIYIIRISQTMLTFSRVQFWGSKLYWFDASIYFQSVTNSIIGYLSHLQIASRL